MKPTYIILNEKLNHVYGAYKTRARADVKVSILSKRTPDKIYFVAKTVAYHSTVFKQKEHICEEIT